MKKLFNLKMAENASVAQHLNEFNSLQLVSELGLKISGRVKYHKAHKMKTKGIFTEGGVDCSFVVI